MSHRLMIGLVCVASCLISAMRALAAIPEPVDVPYAPDRPLATTQFVRFEWHDASRDRTVPVKIYFPVDHKSPAPVILFSHGLGGTREAYAYLGRQWAAHGYVVVHLQHPGSDDRVWRGQRDRAAAMRSAANGRNAIDRAKDVSFAIDQFEILNRGDNNNESVDKDAAYDTDAAARLSFKHKLDLAHIGLSGHSFGGQTTMLAIGQRLGGARGERLVGDLSDPRITAAIPMSAAVPAARGNLDEIYANVKTPVFLMTGTLDDSPLNDTTAADRRLPFDHLPGSPAYLLILTDGDHMVFSGRRVSKLTDPPQQSLIRQSSTAFWDAYLRDDAEAHHWLAEGGFQELLGEGGTFEQK